MNASRRQHTLTLLRDGRVLAVGGISGTTFRGAEVYQPASNQWNNTLAMTIPRQDHEAALLADGRVLVLGGYNGGLLSAAELYTPSSGAWSATGSANRTHDVATAVALDNGAVLIAGGCATTACSSGTASAELFDPSIGQFREVAAMSDARVTHVAAKLGDGRVLIAAGLGGGLLSSAELFSLGGGGEACAVGIECVSGSCSASVCDPSAGGAAGSGGTSGAGGATGSGGAAGAAASGGAAVGGAAGNSGGAGGNITDGAASFGANAGSGGTAAGAAGASARSGRAADDPEPESFYGCAFRSRARAREGTAWLAVLLLFAARRGRRQADVRQSISACDIPRLRVPVKIDP
jgi:hypothetical protein